MSRDLSKAASRASELKNVILENNNIDILLFLAKYNPKVTIDTIIENFGKESVKGLKNLEKLDLIVKKNKNLTLTEEGIFQVEGLLTMVAF